MNETQFPDTREQWLNAAVRGLKQIFDNKGYSTPGIRVSCGWPSARALGAKKRRLGECWAPEASKDKTTEIFISPYLEDVVSECGVLAVLTHELVHAAVGIDAKHGKLFKACALAIGLKGKMTETLASEELLESLKALAETLGAYPHARLDMEKRPTKKQTTRMVKCLCEHEDCGFLVRTTKKWIEEVGAPHCPLHGAMTVVMPEEKPEDDDGDGEESDE